MATDWAFLVLLLVDLACLGLMAWIGMRMAATGKAAAGKVQPLAQRAQRTAATGKRLAESAKASGTHIARDVREVAALVQRRVGTVRQLIAELRPPEASKDEAKEIVRAAQTAVEGGRQWSGKFAGLRRAAQAASRRGRAGGDR